MARKVNVYRHDHSHFQVRRKQAEEMVSNGLATRIDKWNVSLVAQSHHEPRGMETSNQGAIYELAAIEKYRKFSQGGLTRDEHRPIKFQAFRAARVGHQP